MTRATTHSPTGLGRQVASPLTLSPERFGPALQPEGRGLPLQACHDGLRTVLTDPVGETVDGAGSLRLVDTLRTLTVQHGLQGAATCATNVSPFAVVTLIATPPSVDGSKGWGKPAFAMSTAA